MSASVLSFFRQLVPLRWCKVFRRDYLKAITHTARSWGFDAADQLNVPDRGT